MRGELMPRLISWLCIAASGLAAQRVPSGLRPEKAAARMRDLEKAAQTAVAGGRFAEAYYRGGAVAYHRLPQRVR